MLDAVSILLDPMLDSVRYRLPKDYAVYTTFFLALWRIERSYGLQRRVERLEQERTQPMNQPIQQDIPLTNYNVGRKYYRSWNPKYWYLYGQQAKTLDLDIFHWMACTLAEADRRFHTKGQEASATFGIEDDKVYQWVRMGDTSFNSGDMKANVESVSYEISAAPGRNASDATYESVSQLYVKSRAARGLSPNRNTMFGHNHFSATQCPGTIDIDRIYRRAMEIWNGASSQGIDQPVNQPAQQGALASATIPVHFLVEQTYRANWRNEPNTSSGIFATYDKGSQVWCSGTVQGQDPYGSGNTTWYKSERSGKFLWSGAAKRI